MYHRARTQRSQLARRTRRFGAIGLAAALAGALLSPLPASAAEATGSIQGRLVNATGVAVAGQVTAASGDVSRTATAEADGSYEIDGLAPGSYTVRFEPSDAAAVHAPFGYVDAWFPNVRHPDDATRVVVNAGSDTLFVDSALTAASRVSGRVGGAPGDYVVALVDRPAPENPLDGLTYASRTASDGSFEFRASAFDDYQLLVYRASGDEWLPYYVDLDGEFDLEVGSAQDVEVFSLQAIPAPGALDFFLQLPDGSPAAGFEATAFRTGGGGISRTATTDANGRAHFDELPPGTWNVTVNEVDRVYPPLFVRGMLVVSGRTSDLTSSLAGPLPNDMTATPGNATADLRLLLDRKGTRLEMSDEDGLEGVSWVLEDDDSGDARRGEFGYSPANGWTADVPTDAVVGTGELGITLTYELGLTELTIADVVVPAVRDSSSLTPQTEGVIDAPARVEATQAFDVTGVRAGEWYEVVFFSDAVSVGWVQAEDSGVLRVAAPGGLSGSHRIALWSVDGELLGWDALEVYATDTTPGTIAGSILSQQGSVVAGTAKAESASGDVFFSRAGVTGDYALEVAPGQYTVSFVPDEVSDVMVPWGYATGYWQDATDPRDATPVTVAPGALVADIDAALVPNGYVSGRVGGPEAHYVVLLTRAGELAPEDGGDPREAGMTTAEVGADGEWGVPIAPGTYGATLYQEFASGWWPIASYGDGGTFDIVSREETSGIDIAVPALGGLVIVVRDPAGAPIDGARAAVRASDRGWTHVARTDADGIARFDGLLAGPQQIAVRTGSPYSRLAIDGLSVQTGEPEVLEVTLGDPLPRGFTATGARAVGDLLLVDRGTVGLSVPAAAGVDAISYTPLFSDETARAAADGSETPFVLTDGVWRAGVDTSRASGRGALVLAIDEVGLTARTWVDAVAPALLDPDELTDETRGALSAPGAVAAGSTLAVSGLTGGQWFSFGITGSDVGAWVQASPEGVALVPVGAGSALGAARIALFDIDGSLVGWVGVHVTAAPSPAPTPGALAATGGGAAWGIGAIALLLVAAGFVVRSRRRVDA